MDSWSTMKNWQNCGFRGSTCMFWNSSKSLCATAWAGHLVQKCSVAGCPQLEGLGDILIGLWGFWVDFEKACTGFCQLVNSSMSTF